MKKIWKYGIPSFIGLAFLGAVTYRIIDNDPSKDTRGSRAPLVRTELPTRMDVSYTLLFTGDVVAGQQAAIYSKIAGNLDNIYATIGQRVPKDFLLAVIDSTEFWQQYQQTSATFQNAKATYQRTKDLFDRSLIARQDLDNAEAAMKVAKANFDLAKTRLGYAKIVAPFGGYITKRFLDAGAVVTANNATLFTLMSIDSVRVTVNVLEKDIPLVHKGTAARVTVDAYADKVFEGVVSRLAEALDLSSRTMAAEIDIPNKDHLLKPGMFATVTLIVADHPKALTVPTMAIMKDDTSAFVYVVENNLAKRQRVTLGADQGTRTEVLLGLSDSVPIIAVGQQLVREGSPVAIQR